MGAGIAQLGVQAGFDTVLTDPDPDALQKGVAYVKKWTEREPLTGSLDGCDLIIEAAPERLELKRQIFASLPEDAILATNTSSILVTSIASAAKRPENVVGMHFFNPPALMKLLEIIPAEQTGDRALDLAKEVGSSFNKSIIVAEDGPGFLVNRCGRPFYSEALQLLRERVATHEQIDRIVRFAGFRMGPFELMDLVGIDVGFEVAKSFDAQAFGAEPRWKPSMLQARKVAAGTLGRKTGKGWYAYPPGRPDDPEPAGGEINPAWLERPGVHALPPYGSLVELTPEADDATVALFADFQVERVQEPVLERIVCQLVNEAMFAVGEGVGSPEDVDRGMKLGLNYPRGPLEWGELIGFPRVRAVLGALEGERYRIAPLLRRA
jgi:3-hydroxybutyryl-CoA dehydrogenase